jgi:hypothetical protein
VRRSQGAEARASGGARAGRLISGSLYIGASYISIYIHFSNGLRTHKTTFCLYVSGSAFPIKIDF